MKGAGRSASRLERAADIGYRVLLAAVLLGLGFWAGLMFCFERIDTNELPIVLQRQALEEASADLAAARLVDEGKSQDARIALLRRARSRIGESFESHEPPPGWDWHRLVPALMRDRFARAFQAQQETLRSNMEQRLAKMEKKSGADAVPPQDSRAAPSQ